jgi:hypothetical protein
MGKTSLTENHAGKYILCKIASDELLCEVLNVSMQAGVATLVDVKTSIHKVVKLSNIEVLELT